MTDTDRLTIGDAVALADIIRAAHPGHGSRVRRAVESGDVLTGIARSIGDQQGRFVDGNAEVRDCYVRVTLTTGSDVYWPLRELVTERQSGEFVIGDE